MKETQIAQINVDIYRSSVKIESIHAACLEHKQTLLRFLEFLEEEMKRWTTLNEISEAYISTGELEEKITDLKQAIRKYNEAGI